MSDHGREFILAPVVFSHNVTNLCAHGSRWRRLEMTRVAYAAVAFVAAKLLFEDLRHGRMEFIAASIFVFALTLIGVPQLARMGTRQGTH